MRYTRPDRMLPVLLGLSGCLGGAEAPPVASVALPETPSRSRTAIGCGDWTLESGAGTSLSLYRGARSLSVDLFPDEISGGASLRPGTPVADMSLVSSVVLASELPEGARVEWGLHDGANSQPKAAIRLEREGIPSVRLLRQARPGEAATVDGLVVEAQRLEATRGTVVLQRRGPSVLLKALWGRATMVQRAEVGSAPLELSVSLSWPRGAEKARGRSIGLLFDRFELQDTGGRITQDLLACP